jgi:hypothetical protein
MPPSFQVDEYELKLNRVEYGDIKSQNLSVQGFKMIIDVKIKINIELVRRVNEVWSIREEKLVKDYVNYPSRCAVGAQFAVDNNVKLKSKKWVGYREELSKWKFSERPFELARYWAEQTYKLMSKGDHVREYVKKHAEAHPKRAVTWNQILAYGWMDELYDFTREVMDLWNEKFDMRGDWCISSDTFNLGMRSRSPDDAELEYQVTITLDQARQIGYATGISSCNAFKKHSDNIRVMRYIFDIYEKIIGCRIISPKTEGGIVYTIIRDAYLEGKIIKRFDVRGMELITPTILNAGFHMRLGIGICVGWRDIIPELLSGVGPTSDFDMIAHLELLVKLIIKPPEIIIILGDDATIIGGLLVNSILYEWQELEDKLGRTLGIICTEFMHPIAHNITVDTANKRINVTQDDLIKGFRVKNKMPMLERERIADYFTGKVGNKELYEILPTIKPEAYVYSPREMIEYGLGFQ